MSPLPEVAIGRLKDKELKELQIFFENKADAIQRAKDLAKQAELGQVLIHGEDNRIQKEHTYGKDPKRYPS